MTAWDKMTRAERRVAICKDVIKQIHAGILNEDRIVDGGRYIDLPTGYRREEKYEDPCPKEVAKDMLRKCSMCARGALLICKTARFNKTLFRDIFLEDTASGLSDAFSEMQLELIECAFEMMEGFSPIEVRGADVAVEFGEEHDNPVDRLLAIMQNIVDHKGKFRPEVRYTVR